MTDKKGLVLCVDDDPNVLHSLQWLLEKDFDVKVADSGAAGLELVRQYDFDVIVTDQRMPGKMGAEFLCEAAKISPRSMRILLTGYSDVQSILRSINDGEIFRFINKPWDIKKLPNVVLEAVWISKTIAPEPSSQDTTRDHPFEGFADSILVLHDDQSMAELIRAIVPTPECVILAKNVADAVAAFDSHEIGIIVADTRVGDIDTTRLLKAFKNFSPAVVTLIYSSEIDSAEVISMINQGQVFRFISKPAQPGVLDAAIRAAVAKRVLFKAHPEFLKRHAVQEMLVEEKQSLLGDIAYVREMSENAGSDLKRNV